MTKFLISFFFFSLLFSVIVNSQTPQWAFNTFATGTGDNRPLALNDIHICGKIH